MNGEDDGTPTKTFPQDYDGEHVDPVHRVGATLEPTATAVVAEAGEKRRPLIQTLDVPIDESGADEVEAKRAQRSNGAAPSVIEMTITVDENSPPAPPDTYDPVVQATRLKAMGFNVIPVLTDIKDPPDVPWERAVRSNPAVFLRNAGTKNYGVLPPPGCFGWDVDKEVPALFADLTKRLGPLPATVSTKSPDGQHLYYRWPEGLARPKGDMFGQVVTRWPFGDKGQGFLVGPGSVIRRKDGTTGTYYRNDAGNEDAVADLPPEWVAAALNWAGTRSERPADHRGEPLAEVRRVPAGLRHGFLRNQARHLAGLGVRGDALFTAVKAIYEAQCVPYTEDELRSRGRTLDEQVRTSIGDVEQFGLDSPDIGAGKVERPVVVGEGGMFRSLDDRLDELEARDPVAFLVDGWVVASGLTFWAGHPKSGKTLALLQLLAGFVAGEPWLGNAVIGGDAVRVGIYVSKEGSRHEYVERGRNLQRHFPGIVGSGRFLDRFLEDISFSDGWLVETRKALTVLEAQYADMPGSLRVLLVLDPLRDLMPEGADENSAKDMNVMKRWCRSLINEFSFLSIVVVHHLRKSADGSTGLEMSGSGAAYGAVDGTVIWKSSKTKAMEAALNDDEDSERLVSVRRLEGSFEVETKGESAFGGKWEYDGVERWMQQPGIVERQEDRVVAAVGRLGPGPHSAAAIAAESGLMDRKKTVVVCLRAVKNKRLMKVEAGYVMWQEVSRNRDNTVSAEMSHIFDRDADNSRDNQQGELGLDERESRDNTGDNKS